jgi:hypothetical protein
MASDLAAKLTAAIRDIDRVVERHDDEGEGWVTRYTMPVGPLHRALGLISGQPDPSAQEECICSPGPGGVHDHCRYARHGSHPSDPQRWCGLCWDDAIADRDALAAEVSALRAALEAAEARAVPELTAHERGTVESYRAHWPFGGDHPLVTILDRLVPLSPTDTPEEA